MVGSIGVVYMPFVWTTVDNMCVAIDMRIYGQVEENDTVATCSVANMDSVIVVADSVRTRSFALWVIVVAVSPLIARAGGMRKRRCGVVVYGEDERNGAVAVEVVAFDDTGGGSGAERSGGWI